MNCKTQHERPNRRLRFAGAVTLMATFAILADGISAKDRPATPGRNGRLFRLAEGAIIDGTAGTVAPTIVQPKMQSGSKTGAADPAVSLLKRHGVKPTAQSLRAYLKSMLPDSNSQKAQAKLIAQLGHTDYHKREAAMKALLRLPVVSADLLKAAVAGDDPEIRWRAGRVLQAANRRSSEILHAAYRVIARRKIAGLAPEVLATMPLCADAYLLQAASRALVATAEKKDAAPLRMRLRDPSKPVRIAALRAYAGVLGKAADAELRKLAADEDDRIKYEVARAIVSHGNRDALAMLLKLLDSDDLSVRVLTAKVLRAASGRRFGFVPYELKKNRRTAVFKWRKWIAGSGQTAVLKLPLRETAFELGRTLICDYSRHRVIELDAKGKPVWEKPVGRTPWGCFGLPNGHRIVACYSTRTVTEYDAQGKVVWAKASLPGGPTSVERLDNGNTLLACTDSSQVLEVNRRGDVVWKVTIRSRPTDAHRLDNGHTLITLQNGHRVVEVDRKGKVVWTLTGVSSPFSAYRLDNGNTLVAAMGNGAVREYDRKGTLVWQKTGLSSPYDCQRLGNGNTLVSDSRGIREIDRKGTTVWMHTMSGVSKFHRY
ncbi:MAG: PQQ-binding-like beta-propeller repeat protein [Planctomycetaceae bacterium]